MSDLPASFTFIVDSAHAGSRLDWVVADRVEYCSRSFAAALIRKQKITVNGVSKKPGYVLKVGECVTGTVDPPQETTFRSQDIQISILYEDDDILVVNKAPGMVVHPAPGHAQGTLVNALMHHCSDLAGICGSLRPGIVHRLDKDTSGALVVAKTDLAMHHLSNQFKARLVRKHYLALVFGVPEMDHGRVELPIGRHPQDRKKMSVITRTPRAALTFWQVRERYNGASLLELDIRTGRTHQIRVHCTAMGHPLIGDPVYCRRGDNKRLARLNPDMAKLTLTSSRQMLHAWKLHFTHPVNEKTLAMEALLPEDMARLINRFRRQ